jgi:hypothetical protein
MQNRPVRVAPGPRQRSSFGAMTCRENFNNDRIARSDSGGSRSAIRSASAADRCCQCLYADRCSLLGDDTLTRIPGALPPGRVTTPRKSCKRGRFSIEFSKRASPSPAWLDACSVHNGLSRSDIRRKTMLLLFFSQELEISWDFTKRLIFYNARNSNFLFSKGQFLPRLQHPEK